MELVVHWFKFCQNLSIECAFKVQQLVARMQVMTFATDVHLEENAMSCPIWQQTVWEGETPSSTSPSISGTLVDGEKKYQEPASTISCIPLFSGKGAILVESLFFL